MLLTYYAYNECIDCFILVIYASRGDSIDDIFKYMDEVLSVHVPWAIKEAGLEVYDMPNFVNDVQFRSSDGSATTCKANYYAGNVTGLQNLYRKTCTEPRWNSGNLTVNCHIVFPKTTVRYIGRIQLLSSHSQNMIRFRQKDIDVEGVILDMEASLNITVSPYVKTPNLKALTIVDGGRNYLQFSDPEFVTVELLRSHFYHKFNYLFLEVFYEHYKPAIERGIQSIPYPL